MRIQSLLIFLSFFLVKNTFAQEIEVDHLPTFTGCESFNEGKQKQDCSLSNLQYYLVKNLIYPDSAKAKGVSGTVYVNFTVENDGKISNVRLLNDIGEGCGAMAKKVVEEMPNWQPATFKNEKVAYELRLPIRFLLDDGQKIAREYQFFWGNIRKNELQVTELKKCIDEKIIVRMLNGDEAKIINLMLVYENGKTLKKLNSQGELSKEMQKTILKAKSNGKITFTVTLQQKGQFFEIFKSYNVL
jgi:TonB family protein